MAEYIEREAATAYAPLPKELREYQTGNLDDAWDDGYDFAISQINAIPAADVRPVVTCAECKHNNACLTQAFIEDESRVPFDRNTFFCADGKR